MSESECIAIIEQATKVQVRERLMSWLSGTDDLPYNEILQAVGYSVKSSPKRSETGTFGEKIPSAAVPSTPYLGWTLADAGGKIVVRSVEDGSPAQQAGIGIDDEIVAVDGIRILTPAQADFILGQRIGKTATLVAHCDGRVYSTSISPAERMVPALVEIDGVSERQLQMRNRWLLRTL
jgi:predicted metalloprotease with PDZ domain